MESLRRSLQDHSKLRETSELAIQTTLEAERQKHSSAIQALQNQLFQKTNHLEQANQALQEKDALTTSLSQQLQNLQTQLEETTKAAAATATDQIHSFTQQLNAARAENIALHSSLQASQHQLSREATEANSTINSLSQQLASSRSQCSLLQTRLDELAVLQTTLAERDSRIKQLSETIQTVTTERDSRIKSLEDSVQKLLKELDQAKHLETQRSKELASNNKELDAIMTQKTNENQILQSKLEDLAKEAQDLKRILADRDDLLDQAQVAMEQMQEELKSESRRGGNAQAELSTLQNDLRESNLKNSRLSKTLQENNQELQNLQLRHEKLVKERDIATRQVQLTEKKCQDLSKEATTANKALQRLQTEQESLEKEKDNLTRQLNITRKQMEDLQKEITSTNKELKRLEARAEALLQEKTLIQSQLGEQQAKYLSEQATLQKQVDALLQEVADLKRNGSLLLKQLDTTRNENEDMRKQLSARDNQTNNEAAELRSRVSQLRIQLVHSKEEFDQILKNKDNTIAKLQETVNKLNAKKDSIKEQYDAKLKKLQQSTSNSKQEKSEFVKQYISDLEELRAALLAKDEELSDMRRQNETGQFCQQSLQQAKENILILQNQVTQLTAQNSALQQQVQMRSERKKKKRQDASKISSQVSTIIKITNDMISRGAENQNKRQTPDLDTIDEQLKQIRARLQHILDYEDMPKDEPKDDPFQSSTAMSQPTYALLPIGQLNTSTNGDASHASSARPNNLRSQFTTPHPSNLPRKPRRTTPTSNITQGPVPYPQPPPSIATPAPASNPIDTPRSVFFSPASEDRFHRISSELDAISERLNSCSMSHSRLTS